MRRARRIRRWVWWLATAGVIVVAWAGIGIWGMLHAHVQTLYPSWCYRIDDYTGSNVMVILPGGGIFAAGRYGNLYFVDHDGSLLNHISPPSGERFWRACMDDTGRIYASTARSSRIYAYTPDGTELWCVELSNASSTSPKQAQGQTILTVGPDGLIYATNLMGEVMVLDRDGHVRNNFSINTYITSLVPVAVTHDGTMYISTWDGDVIAFSKNSIELWRQSLQVNKQIRSCQVGSDGNIYVSTTDGAYALNPDGTIRWQFTNPYLPYSLYHAKRYTIAINEDHIVYIASGSTLFALDLDGSTIWEHKTSGQVLDPFIGPDGTVYCQVWDVSKLDALIYKFSHTFYMPPGLRSIYGDQGCFIAISPKGEEIWRRRLNCFILFEPELGPEGEVYAFIRDKNTDSGNPAGEICRIDLP